MKRYIDLFTQQVKQNKYLIFLNKAKKIGLISLISLFTIFLLEAAGYFFLMRQISTKEQVKKKYNTFIVQNNVFDSKINYFAFKYALLRQNLSGDANVSYYYGLLRTFLSTINSEATIVSFSLDNEQLVKFNLSFSTYDQALSFMSQLEKEKLPDYFQSLKLKEFSVTNQEIDNYVLEFEGTIKKVKDAT